MFIYNVPPSQYDRVLNAIRKQGSREPLQASYVLTLQIEKDIWRLTVQQKPTCQLALLQAVRSKDGSHTLTTKPPLLTGLMEIWLSQFLEEEIKA